MRDRDDNVSPDFLSQLEEEQDYMASQKSRGERLKIPKGSSWLSRFVPIPLGPRKKFYARIAFHWINKRPVLCVRHTAEDFGGEGKDARCEICDLADELNQNKSKKISYVGYKATAVTQWLTHCLVFKKDDELVRGEEKWMPYEFWMHKSVWGDFYSMLKKGFARAELSILDWEKGCDIWIDHGSRGYRLNREDPAPIIKLDPQDPEKLDRIIKKVLGNAKFRPNKAPDQEAIDEARDKLEEMATRASRSRNDRGGRDDYGNDDDEYEDDRGYGEDDRGGRGRGSRDEDEYDDRGEDNRDGRSERSSRRFSSGEDDRDDRVERSSRASNRDEDDRGGRSSRSSREDDHDERGPRRSSREDERGSDRRSFRSSRDEDERGDDRESEDDDRDSQDVQDEGERDEESAVHQAPPPRFERREAPPSRASNPPPARARSGGTAQSTVDEEEDNAPEEKHDPAPPLEQNIDEDEENGAPPPVTPPKSNSNAAKTSGGLSSRLKEGIAGANRRQ